jgi:hypothetical protein
MRLSSSIPAELVSEDLSESKPLIAVSARSKASERACPRSHELAARRSVCNSPLCPRRTFVAWFDEEIVADRARGTSRLERIVHNLGRTLGRGLAFIFFAVALSATAHAGEIREIAIERGKIGAVAVASGGAGVAAVVSYLDDPGDRVRWWDWNGTNDHWSASDPRVHIRALGFHPDGTLLVGDSHDSRIADMRWWKIGHDGAVIAECIGYPLGEWAKRGVGAIRGVHSFAVLGDGTVVTGGLDSTLGVWRGCEPRWLNADQCCYAEMAITVTPDGDGFITSGEGVWRGDARGYEVLGRRRWSPSPWRAVPVASLPAGARLQANGERCYATVDPQGQITVDGPHPWSVIVDPQIWRTRGSEGAWRYLGVAHDCSAVVAATKRRLLLSKQT